MKKLLKWIFGIVLSMVLLAGVGAALLLFVVDPNNYKPQIEQLAKDNGVTVQIAGDLSWQLIPEIAITVGGTQVTGAGLPDIQFRQADLAVDLGKLLGGDIAINKIAVSQPVIRLELTDANAAEQAAVIAAAPVAAAEARVTPATSDSMTLAIKSLKISDGALELLENGAVQQRIENLDISGRQLNLNQQPFPLSVELTTSITDVAEQLSLRLTTDIAIDSAFQQLSLTESALQASIESNAYGNHQLSANLATVLNLAADTLELPNVAIQLDGVPLRASAHISSLTRDQDIEAKIEIPGFAPQPLLKSFNIDSSVLPAGKLALKTALTSKADSVLLSALKLTVDDFTLTGTINARLAERHEIKASLKGTALNLDRYLPEGEEQAEEQQPEALFAPLLAPLAALNGGKGQVEINLAQLTMQGVQLDNLHLNAFGNGSVIQVADASADGFGGNLKSSARIDMGSATPKLTFNVTASSVDMGQALTTLADFKELSGHGNLKFSGASAGNNSDEIVANLKGSGNFQLTKPAYSALNIEQQFCAVAGDKEQQPASWPKGSQFNNVESNFTLNGQTLHLHQLHTSVGNIQLKGAGSMALLDGLMDMSMVFNINGAKSSEAGCVIRSKSIQNRDIPIHLKGSIDNMNSVISNALVELVTKMVVEKKAGKLLDKLLGGDKEQQDPDSEQPKDSKEQVKDLLKDLLKKR